MNSIRDTRIGLTAAIALVALFGLAGRMDYVAQREAECASYIKPHAYDELQDRCVLIPDHQPTEQEHYHAAPQASRPQHH